MRYRMWKGESGEDTVLMTAAWPEPYGFEATPEEQKCVEQFDFSADGIAAAVDWLNRQSVSYTHLDVYKRQVYAFCSGGICSSVLHHGWKAVQGP